MLRSLKRVMGEVIKKMGIKNKIEENGVFEAWGKVVGNGILKNTEPYLIKNGALFVGVSNSVWAHELSMMTPYLIKELNKHLKKELVTGIKFKMMNIKKAEEASLEKVTRDLKETKLETKEVGEIKLLVERVRDPKIRRGLIKLMVVDKKNKKTKCGARGNN